ncbi:hypothetical protein D3C87_1040730 [compost metagenome]
MPIEDRGLDGGLPDPNRASQRDAGLGEPFLQPECGSQFRRLLDGQGLGGIALEAQRAHGGGEGLVQVVPHPAGRIAWAVEEAPIGDQVAGEARHAPFAEGGGEGVEVLRAQRRVAVALEPDVSRKLAADYRGLGEQFGLEAGLGAQAPQGRVGGGELDDGSRGEEPFGVPRVEDVSGEPADFDADEALAGRGLGEQGV